MIIKHAEIEQFRALKNIDFDLGSKLTVIVGHNGTMKTTLLGILSQTFTISSKSPLYGSKTVDGYNFKSQFSEKFKLSDKDVPGEHKWSLELYPGIYNEDVYGVKSVAGDSSNRPLRFVSNKGKKKGAGYPQVPVYYISLKRTTPIGEERKFKYHSELTEDEKSWLLLEYQDIFSLVNCNGFSVDSVSSSRKHTASVHAANCDALAISAGQDNLGKILLAVLSYKRLKEQFGEDYKGGIILIDEIESTLHPAAQKKLIKRLLKYATKYKIQFIVTTHSPTVVKTALFDKHNKNEIKLVYLKNTGGVIYSYNDTSVNSVIAELNGEVVDSTAHTKIDLFSEDDVALSLIKKILQKYSKKINYQTCSLGAEEYIELAKKGPNIFKESLIVLDGDKNDNKNRNDLKRNKVNNVLFLPSNDAPEKMFYKFLFSLDDNDEFWNNNPGGFDKQKCFADFTNLKETSSTEEYKKWYEAQKQYFGTRNSKLYNRWVKSNENLIQDFIEKFVSTYNLVAKDTLKDLI